MNAYNVSRVVIVKHNHPIGIVTLKDFLPSSIFYILSFLKTVNKQAIYHLKVLPLNLFLRGPNIFYWTGHNEH